MTSTPPGPEQPGWSPAPQPATPPDHPNATKAMVLGIVALAGGLTCYLPLLIGPWAWVAGRKAVKEIDAQPGQYGGRPQAQAGYVLGVIATVLLVLFALLIVGILSLLIVAPGGPAPIEGRSL